MTINEIAAAINARRNAEEGTEGVTYFSNDFAGHYDMSSDEAERIAARATSIYEFESIWQNTDWWTDANN